MKPASRPAALAAALFAAAAAAQSPPAAAPLPYRSAFEGYRPFADQEVAPWKQANDEVGRIGGWRAYAREAHAAPAAVPASAPQRAAPPNSPAGTGADPHAGHH